jgi:chemotaxis signal transduction protein
MDNLNLLNLNASIGSESDLGDERYVIFNLAESTFAVSCKYVVSIEKPTKITEMANAPLGVRGIGYSKDEAINIFDLRIIFGYPSHEYHVEQEINIGGHIMEHERWLEELKNGVADVPGFDSDPFKCNLGKWLEGYKTSSLSVQNLIDRIMPAHEKFHKLADKAANVRSDKQNEAESFAAEADAVSGELAHDLQELHQTLLQQSKEMIIILKVNNKKIGIIIDNAENVETMDEIQELPPAVLATEYVRKLGFRKKDRQITLILEAEMFVPPSLPSLPSLQDAIDII